MQYGSSILLRHPPPLSSSLPIFLPLSRRFFLTVFHRLICLAQSLVLEFHSWLLVFILPVLSGPVIPLKSGSPARLFSWFRIRISICHQLSPPRRPVSMSSVRPQLKSTLVFQNYLLYCLLLYNGNIIMQTLNPGIFSGASASQPISEFCPSSPPLVASTTTLASFVSRLL